MLQNQYKFAPTLLSLSLQVEPHFNAHRNTFKSHPWIDARHGRNVHMDKMIRIRHKHAAGKNCPHVTSFAVLTIGTAFARSATARSATTIYPRKFKPHLVDRNAR